MRNFLTDLLCSRPTKRCQNDTVLDTKPQVYKAKGLRPARAEEESVADNSTRTQDASLVRTFDKRIFEASFLVFAVIFPQFVNVKTPTVVSSELKAGQMSKYLLIKNLFQYSMT